MENMVVVPSIPMVSTAVGWPIMGQSPHIVRHEEIIGIPLPLPLHGRFSPRPMGTDPHTAKPGVTP